MRGLGAAVARGLGLAILFAATSWLCWNLRGHRLEGGDTALFLSTAFDPFLRSESWTFFFREPLSFFMPQVLGHAIGYAWPREDILALPSCLAGGLFAVLLALASRRPGFWLIMLANATGFLFLGHLENYSFAYVAIVATTLLGWRAGRGEARLWHVAAVWALALAFHQAAAFMALGAIPLIRRGGTRDRELSLMILIALCLFYVLFTIAGALDWGRIVVYGTTGSLREMITPLTEAQADWVEDHSQMGAWMRYTMLSAAHWRDVGMFQLWLCPLGLLALAVLTWQRRDAGDVFLLLAGGGMFAWSFVWHPHMGWNDWDLWSLMAAPLNTAAALVFSGERPFLDGEAASEPAPA